MDLVISCICEFGEKIIDGKILVFFTHLSYCFYFLLKIFRALRAMRADIKKTVFRKTARENMG
jgi:hypothetical protein